MGRLEQNQNKQLNTSVFLSLVFLIVVIVLIFTYGFKLLLGTSAFIARLSENKSTNTLDKNQNLIEDIDINVIPVATNSAKILVGGSVVNFDKVEFYLNGDLVKETALLVSDNFEEEIGDLNTGQNDVYVIGKTKDESAQKKSKVFPVFYKNEKPKLEITEPQDGLKTNQPEVKIVGQTDKETYIKVNDLPVVVDAQGIFQTSVRLKEGENKINLIALDIAENSEQKILTVIYEKE